VTKHPFPICSTNSILTRNGQNKSKKIAFHPSRLSEWEERD